MGAWPCCSELEPCRCNDAGCLLCIGDHLPSCAQAATKAAPQQDADNRSDSGAESANGGQAFAEGGSAADYKRAKRFKRLTRLLTGSAARQIVNRFFLQAGAMAVFVMLVTLACFMAAQTLILGQSGMVQSIQTIGMRVDTETEGS